MNSVVQFLICVWALLISTEMDETNKNKLIVCANTAYNNRILNQRKFYNGGAILQAKVNVANFTRIMIHCFVSLMYEVTIRRS